MYIIMIIINIICLLSLFEHFYFLLSSHINLKESIFAQSTYRLLINIYTQIKFCYVIHLIFPKNALLNYFSYHYFGNHPIWS